MTTRTRRTPEELAAYHLAKANKARAKAARLKKEAELQKIFDLGKAVMSAGDYQPDDVAGLLVLGKLMTKGFGLQSLVCTKDDKHWSALEKLFKPEGADRRVAIDWWISKNLPMS